MKIIGIVFARLDSQRFPGKALSVFAGKPLVVHILNRASYANELYNVVLATTTRTIDDELASTVKKYGFDVFRGNYLNVAERGLSCAQFYKADAFARLNGDSPVIDTKLLDKGCVLMRNNRNDFITNLYPFRTYPYGISVEIINTIFYSNLCKLSQTLEESEHMTSSIYKKINDISYGTMPECPFPCQIGHLTIDEPHDSAKVEQYYSEISLENGTVLYDKLSTIGQ